MSRRRTNHSLDIRDVHVIKNGDVFMLCDRFGDIRRGNDAALGLYFRDTRFLSRFEVWIDRAPPVFLHSVTDTNYSILAEATLPIDVIDPSGRALNKNLSVLRRRWLENGMRETLEVHNHGIGLRRIRIEFAFDADFLDVFEVRGMTAARGKSMPPDISDRSVTIRYKGLDGVERRLELGFEPAPTKLGPNGARFELDVPPQSGGRVLISATPVVGYIEPRGGDVAELSAEEEAWSESCTHIRGDGPLRDCVDRAILDLKMLRPETNGTPLVDAGVPWFSTLFGRDALIASYESLSLNPDMAKATLIALAERQGSRVVDRTEEEPGKIMHELRRGELAGSGAIPHTPYFGSIDATPLWLMVYGAVWRWTGDLEFARRLLPNALRAIEWIDEYGDADGDGYVEYAVRSADGLENQGWKDSHDAIVHSDGSLAAGPIALVEVQGYVYAAKRWTADVARALGRPDLATALERQAGRLKRRFDRDFWMPAVGYYALALDGAKRQVGAITSNPGHCLWSGIVCAERVAPVIKMLLSDELSTGWGIRTLSARNPAYDPVGYHTGTVWPHDTALIGHGMKMRGWPEAAMRVMDQLCGAAEYFHDSRFPELFCGFSREDVGVPVDYPVACRPQAFAAGTGPLMTATYFGLVPDAADKTLNIVRPTLPRSASVQDVLGLRVGDGDVDLGFRRENETTLCRVLGRGGGIEIAVRY